LTISGKTSIRETLEENERNLKAYPVFAGLDRRLGSRSHGVDQKESQQGYKREPYPFLSGQDGKIGNPDAGEAAKR